MSSSVSFPHCSLTLPVNCFQLPCTRSQFIVVLPWWRSPLVVESRSERTRHYLLTGCCVGAELLPVVPLRSPARQRPSATTPSLLRVLSSCILLVEISPGSVSCTGNGEERGASKGRSERC